MKRKTATEPDLAEASAFATVFVLITTILLSLGCNGGGGGSSAASARTYEERVSDYKEEYGKTDEWEAWMLAYKTRYSNTFSASLAKPGTITVSFWYETTPIAYNPAWASEDEHMAALKTLAEGAYPGYTFDFIFEGNTGTSYANVIAGTADETSYADGKTVYLYYETIFNHEFGHVMKLLHHYDTMNDMGEGMYMPPGDTVCIMDRTSSMYCSACRTALGLPLDATDIEASDAAMTDILSRYP